MRRLLSKRANRWAERVFVAEGTELVRAALEDGPGIESLYLAPAGVGRPEVAALRQRALVAGARVFDLAPGVLERVADAVTPQPVLAVVPMLHRSLDDLDGDLVVVCADLRDPGNAGSVLRSADAAGARAVVWCGDTVDPYNPKAVRASAGSLFHVPLAVEHDAVAALAALAERRYRCLGAVARGGTEYTAVDWRRPTAVVLGNEASGLPPSLLDALDDTVAIPMVGRAESLNVGVAWAVLCFEALRQRRAAGPTMPPMSGPDA